MLQEELLAQLRGPLKAIACRFSGDPGEQEDLAQEGWIEAWRKLQQHPGQTVAWYRQAAAYRIRAVASGRKAALGTFPRSHSAVVDAIPTDTVRMADQVAAPEEPDSDHAAELDLFYGALRKTLAEAIEALPPRQREYTGLRYLEGWTLSELKELFGYDPSSLWYGPRNAQERLAKSLAHLIERDAR